ncbi:MAG: sorbosone dehydrogenase family protein [Thermoleophilia bacterium]
MSRSSQLARAAAAAAACAGALALPALASAEPVGEPVRIATGLKTPWDMAIAPDGRIYIPERDGDIRVMAGDQLQAEPAMARDAIDPDVRKLLGMVLHPAFATNHLAYLYVSRAVGGTTRNGIVRLRESGGRFTLDRWVFDGIGSDGNHDGGRMAFGPDGALYVTTGDIHNPDLPQDLQSLNGKILRFAAPGDETTLEPAPGNPFLAQGGNARYVWSYGHRHPQGLAFDTSGRLWETEHGPTGEQYDPVRYPGGAGKSSRDELNVIVAGGNYGWPVISGTMTREGMRSPVATSGDGPAWAPAYVSVGADGSIYAPMLAGQHLRRFDVRQGAVFNQVPYLQGGDGLGRLRLAVPRGQDLLIAQDGNSAGIYRQRLSPRVPGGSDAADPQPGGSSPAPGPSSPAGPGRLFAAPSAPTAKAARTLARRLGAKMAGLGVRRLVAGRGLTARAGGFPKGRVVLQLRLGSATGPTIGSSQVRIARPRAAAAFHVRLTVAGRARVKANTGRRLVVRVLVIPATGLRAVGVARVSIARWRPA